MYNIINSYSSNQSTCRHPYTRHMYSLVAVVVMVLLLVMTWYVYKITIHIKTQTNRLHM